MNNNSLFNFIDNSPTPFHAVANIREILTGEGFTELTEDKPFNLTENGKYFLTRNSSSLIAFTIGSLKDYRFKITASHTDSPAFKLKSNGTLQVKDHYLKLNTEGYGGMLLAPWFDRPLSIAGRVITSENDQLKETLVNIDKNLAVIPNLAIHLNRKANEGVEYNKQVDMLPLIGGAKCDENTLNNLLADASGCSADDILSSDIYLYNRDKATYLGANDEFIGAPRLDDLECVFACLQGFISSSHETTSGINVLACFDNEEVGSLSRQGAASTLLADTLKRINLSLGKTEEDYLCAIAGSFMLSCDNAHALHPNHPAKTDETNSVYMNEGVVIKQNANQKYTSDAFSIAFFKKLCEKANVKYQHFANRSDEPGGSTLGNIAMSQVSVRSVDIGLACLGMHSTFETAGADDLADMIAVNTEFYLS